MISRVATFVDAGYLFAASSQLIKSKQVARRNIRIVSPEKLLKGISDQSIEISGSNDVLRTYWYDAIQSSRLSLEQTEIATLAGVKLRLGTLNSAGEQKGVDSLIVTDLIELARNKAIADAVLISGDEDLRIAVQVAQTYGVRVHILAIGDHRKNVSQTLKMESDSVSSLGAEWLSQYIEFSDPAQAAVPLSTVVVQKEQVDGITIEQASGDVSIELLNSKPEGIIGDLNEHFKTSHVVPPEFDGKLIAKTAAIIKRSLTGDEKRKARGVFVTTVRGLLKSG
jgi:uncharacterized LabA/DUF88 family protein